MVSNFGVIAVEFVECGVSALGCEFLATVLGPSLGHPLQVLKLDHNSIGNEGVAALATGLSMNSSVQLLSLAFCNIEAEGARGLFEIVIYQNSGLKELDLQGNCLRNQGVCTLFHGLQINNSLIKVNLSDNQFGEEELVFNKLSEMLAHNTTLTTLDLRFNGIYDSGALVIREMFRPSEDGERINSTLT